MTKIVARDVPQAVLDEINAIDWEQLPERKVAELVAGLRSIISLKKLPKK